MSLEHLYDRLEKYKRAKIEAQKRGNDKILDYVNLKMLSVIKQIREVRERNGTTREEAENT